MRGEVVDFVDLQYATMLSSRLEHFKVRSTNPYKINFRCPVCGDSQKSRSKARGWLLEKDNTFHFYCHNCGVSQSFSYFLKNVDSLAYNDYVTEKFVKNVVRDEKTVLETTKFEKPVFNIDPLKQLKKISQLPVDHPLKKYVIKRGIPSHHHYRMYFAPKFKTWINSIIPNKFEKVGKDEPRLVIPFLDKEGKVFGVSARGFDPNGIRYITIMFKEVSKIFGLDTVDFEKTYFVVEGAIDSLFLSNSVAMAGADGNVDGLNRVDNAIFVFDAEPRNKEIHKRIERLIRAGHRVCIWPSNVPGKDINEMFLNGLNNVEDVIKKNTYKGLEASLKLAAWRKV
jgi:transcription elongation factor Elf1